MIPGIFHIIIRSFRYNIRQVIYQLLVIILLAAVITGSLLTGSSVRASLRKTATEHIGNTGIVVSSGTRYFDNSLSERIRNRFGIDCTGILEITGLCQKLSSGETAQNAHIYAVNTDFF